MSTFQKVIKYVAIAFALFLAITIVKFGIDIAYVVVQSIGSAKVEEKYSEATFSQNSTELDINLSISSLTIKHGESFRYESNVNGLEYNQVDNKLIIKDNNKNNMFKSNNSYVILYVPEGLIFDKVSIKMGVGKLDIEDVSLNNVNFDLGIGKAIINSDLSGHNVIKCGIGELDLNLNLDNDQYTFDLEKGIGSIKVNEVSVSDDGRIGNGINYISVDGGIGKIDIRTK